MKHHAPASRTCGRSPGARCRRCSSTTPRPAPTRRRRCAPTAPTSSASSCASACWSTSSQRDLAHHHPRRAGAAAARARRRSGSAACSTATARSSPAARRRRPGIPYTLSTMSICSIEDVAAAVDKPFWFQLYVMQDRGFVQVADRARRGGEMQRAGADRRSAGARPAPLRRPQRPDRAAGDQARERHRHRDQAGLGARSILTGKRKTFGNLAGSREAAWTTSTRWRHGPRASSIRR